MATVFDRARTPFFPDHDLCFGDSWNSSTVCQNASDVMITFLNISQGGADRYLDVYCSAPPDDSCAFGYCPNPDVASPAVRFSTYFSSLVSAILVLYSPEEVSSAFFAQLLNVYSLIVAAMVSIAARTLTKMHSAIALTLAASPLSLYLIFYVCRSLMGRSTRLEAVFGPGKYLNRTLVLLMPPLWITLLTFTALPPTVWQFQQAACDYSVGRNHIALIFFLPFIVLFVSLPGAGAFIVLSLLVSWGIAVFRLRKIIWKKKNRILPLGRLWRKVVERYPFIQFYSVVIVPHFFWMLNVEVGLVVLSARESFSATYGQLLAIFVTIPPFISLCMLLPRIPRWFMDLTWVRFLMRRSDKPHRRNPPRDDSALPMQTDPDRANLLGQKVEGLPGEGMEMDPLPTAYKGSEASSRSLWYESKP